MTNNDFVELEIADSSDKHQMCNSRHNAKRSKNILHHQLLYVVSETRSHGGSDKTSTLSGDSWYKVLKQERSPPKQAL